jgi:hypothetical protein
MVVASMLDDPDKSEGLLAALEAALPFVVHVTPALARHLRAQHVDIGASSRQIVSKVSYAGDEGGILCHIAPPDGREVLIVSLTHVRVPPSMPLAAKVLQHQKHRINKLKKQSRI